MSSQISIEELIDSYQKELGVLIHNKIMNSIQIEKLNARISELEIENSRLLELSNTTTKKPPSKSNLDNS